MHLNPPDCPSLLLAGIRSRVGGYLTVLAALLLTLLAPSALAAPTACNILYAIQPQNSSAFGAAITIENTGTTAITSWSLTWSFANGQTVSSLWNGIESQSGANVTVTNESYNGSIAAGGSLTGMGFNGAWNGSANAVPTAFSLSGTACSVNGVAPSGGGSFSLKPSAATLSIVQGASVTDAITVTDTGGFTGTVTLAASSSNSGVTVTVSGDTLTIKASSTATGTATITITGTSGTTTSTATISVTVTTAVKAGFTLTPSPANCTIPQGGSCTVTLGIIDTGGFSGTVTFTATSSNPAITATLSGATLTIKASSTATAGTYAVTVTGTSGTTTATTSIAVTVTTTSTGSFTLSSSLSQITVVAGSTATDSILVTPVSGFTGSVTLAVSGLPSSVTSSWSANPASTSSTLTLTASSTATLGTYNASITGTSGSLSQTVGFQLVIGNATASSFSLSVASTTLDVQQNSGIADIVTVHDLNGFTGSVGFNISGLPTGVTPNFNPSTTSTNTLLALAVGTTVTPGSYPVTIEGTTTTGSFSAGVNLTLNVSTGSPLNIAWVSPTSATAGSTVTVLPGGSGNSFGATQGSSAIYFGTTAATVTSWAVNSIQVTVPTLAAGTVNVTAEVNGVTSNEVPFVIAAATPSPTIYNGNATHFGGTGVNAGGCGVPGNIQDTQNYVALNVQNDPGNYTLNLTRPIVAPYLGDIGVWNNGLNCGRYLHVQIGNACEGTNDGTADQTFCRSGAGWIEDQFNGAELDMVVHDSCQDGNSWCRDDPYHLDLNQNVIDDFLLNGTAVGDLFENWSNRQLIWYFEQAPNYTGDIDIYVNQGSGPYATQVILTHLLNGLHGVNYYSNGAWHTGTMVSDNGSVYTILPTTTAGNLYEIQVYDVTGVLINSGRIYSFAMPGSCGTDCSSVTQVSYTTAN